jgi:hypothetical protein
LEATLLGICYDFIQILVRNICGCFGLLAHALATFGVDSESFSALDDYVGLVLVHFRSPVWVELLDYNPNYEAL